jgi:dipeptidyl aminopeptidase/acylaminoacyl peptidase
MSSLRTLMRIVMAAAPLSLGPTAPGWSELSALIPRETLFGNPEKDQARISPDGKRLSWIAPDAKNVLQVWVGTRGQTDEKMVTADPKRGIRVHRWAPDGRTILYLQDSDGDETWHLFGVDLESGRVADLTPFPGVRAEITAVRPAFPDELLVQLNKRDRRLFDVYRLNLRTAELTLDTENPGDVSGWTADTRLQVRAATVATPDGGTEIRLRDDAKSPWRSWLKAGPEEILSFEAFTADGEGVILISSIGSDTARVVSRVVATGEETVVASSYVDADAVLVHPRTHALEAVSFAAARAWWTAVDPSVKADLEALATLYDGDFTIVDRDAQDATWIVAYTSDQTPGRYYAWERASRKGTLIFSTHPKLEGRAIAVMQPVQLTSRDGLALPGYFTLPVGASARNLPVVLLVHGGPWARDRWGFDSEVQWLADRGYAVLQVNYRGSTGHGKKHLRAGFKEWGRKMHDDLIDAMTWAVQQRIADPRKLAIYGGSYGGYATLVGLAYTPDVFACGVDIVGPSNLKTLINSIPPYWKTQRSILDARVGNVDDPKDAQLIKDASPLFRADKIVRPLLIAQGANDPRVKPAESEQIVAAVRKNKGKVTYVLYPDEGHGFARPENRIDFYGRAEAFLAECLGGPSEPVKGDRYPGSTAVVNPGPPRKTTPPRKKTSR